MGIIYFIKPVTFPYKIGHSEHVDGTKVYKIGCSRDESWTRTDSYTQNARVISILRCDDPFPVESEIKKRFSFLFTLVSGTEWFEGNEDDMLREFHDVYLSTSINSTMRRKREEEINRVTDQLIDIDLSKQQLEIAKQQIEIAKQQVKCATLQHNSQKLKNQQDRYDAIRSVLGLM